MGLNNARNVYQSISSSDVKLDLVALIAVIPSSTAYKLSVACPPRSIHPPPCYMGIGMNYYIQESEKFPQWKANAYLLKNGYDFYVENSRTKAWLSMIPESGPGKLCIVNINKVKYINFSMLSLLSYLLPIIALLPGAILGGYAGIIVLVSMILGGVTGALYTYLKDKSDWAGQMGDATKMRLLVFLPEDKWYLLIGKNEDIKIVTAGSAISQSTKLTVLLQWVFKISMVAIALFAANAVLMGQVGLIVAYVCNTAINELIVYTNINKRKSVVINERKCQFVKCYCNFNSKQDMLDHVEKTGIDEKLDEMLNWREHFNLTVKNKSLHGSTI